MCILSQTSPAVFIRMSWLVEDDWKRVCKASVPKRNKTACVKAISVVLLPSNDFKGPAAPTIGPGTKYCTDQTLSTTSETTSSAVPGWKWSRVSDSKTGDELAAHTGRGSLRQDSELGFFTDSLGANMVERDRCEQGLMRVLQLCNMEYRSGDDYLLNKVAFILRKSVQTDSHLILKPMQSMYQSPIGSKFCRRQSTFQLFFLLKNSIHVDLQLS